MGCGTSAASSTDVQSWTDSEGQEFVGKTVRECETALKKAFPDGRVEVDDPKGPKKKRAPDAKRVIIDATNYDDGSGVPNGDALITRVWGYFPKPERAREPSEEPEKAAE